MEHDWSALVDCQKSIIARGFSSGSALLCGGVDGCFFENYEGLKQAADDVDAVDDVHDVDGVDDARGAEMPVNADTIFHWYSMTKVFTVTAALMLYERGLLDIDAPVSRYIKEFADAAVFQDGRTLPAAAAMTVRMLFTMTSGLSYFLSDDSGSAAAMAARWRQALNAGAHWDTVRFARELASVPLEFEPGARFRYGLSHDVLGAIVELVSGQPLDVFFADNIFRPLGMDSTFFRQKLPRELEPRLAKNTAFIDGAYRNIPLPPTPVPIPLFAGIDDAAMLSGGAGLVGTARDYGLFLAEFLRPDNRLLKPETVRLMTSPGLTDRQRSYFNDPNSDASTFGPEHTFAFGVRVQDRAAVTGAGAPGEWGWSGALGTWFFVSPKDNVWFVYMHQHTPAEHGTYITGLRDTFYRILRTGS